MARKWPCIWQAAAAALVICNYIVIGRVFTLEMVEGSEAARRLASMRQVYKKVCPVCGTEFEGIAKRVYDKPACQVKAYRQRKKIGPARRMEGE